MPYFLLTFFALILMSLPATAQEDASTATNNDNQAVSDTVDETTAPASVDNETSETDRKTELSREIHRVRPVKAQIDRAIDSVARQVPAERRNAFVSSLRRMMNYGAMQHYSITAMAETFTVDELEAMLEYYSKPEAQSASEKMSQYQDKLSPEIVKMMDAALMEMRTGRGG